MDGAAELQVAAEAHRQIIEPALFPVQGQKVRQRLGGVVVAAVAGVDHRDGGVHGRYQGRALLGVAHGDDVRIAADGFGGVGYALALGGRGGIGRGKADDIAAQLVHGRLEAEAGAGGGLKKQGGQLFPVTHMGEPVGIRDDLIGRVDQGLDLFHRQVGNTDETSHLPIQLSSEGLARKASSRCTSAGAM